MRFFFSYLSFLGGYFENISLVKIRILSNEFSITVVIMIER